VQFSHRCRERIEQLSGCLKLGACERDGAFSFASGVLLGSVRLPSQVLPCVFLAGERRRRTASEEEEDNENWMDGHLSDGCKGVG
jgi:hypothetical protein